MNGVANFQKKSFHHNWAIANWKDVVQNETITANTKVEILLQEEGTEYAKILVGTSFDQKHAVGFYWKILRMNPALENVQVDLFAEILNRIGEVQSGFQVQGNAEVGRTMEISKSYWPRAFKDFALYTNAAGSLEMRLEFTLKNLRDVNGSSGIEDFERKCRNDLILNLSAMLEDNTNSDVKIHTKDNHELSAHKNILQARCPVFASIFRSQFLEDSTDPVRVDICGKTMKILLNYWYTGELLHSWKDNDTIVEFTYSAGKYQMTQVLQMLDSVLGRDFKAFVVDLELLKITHKLSLKVAESRLLKRIIYKPSQAVNGTELLSWFYATADKFDEESFTIAQITNAWSNIRSANDDIDANFQDIRFLALACKLGTVDVESKLLKRVVRTVAKMSSAEELFALFDLHLE